MNWTNNNNGVTIKTEVSITATVELTEGALRALEAMAGYGDDAFLKAFYVKLGRAYLQPVERDVRELFRLVRATVPPALRAVKEARNGLGIEP
jgi:hypothetical protein